MNMKFKIKGLDCANCAAELERAIQKVEGVTSASISFMSERIDLEIDENSLQIVYQTETDKEQNVTHNLSLKWSDIK